MKDKQKETTREKRGFWRGLRWILLGAVGLYAIVTIFLQQGTINAQQQRRQELTEHRGELEEQLAFLENEKSYIGSDSYMEKTAREKLGWVKEGEIVFKVDEAKDDTQETPDPGDEEQEK